jgi:putative acyl-CoA dehydrogenase
LGGNGYVEDSGMPRLYREAPLNSIWEGSGNINALDVLRIIAKQPEALLAFRGEIEPALQDARIRNAAAALQTLVIDSASTQAQARLIVERMALLWQAALFARTPSNPATDLFIDSRLSGNWGRALGTLPASGALAGVVERAIPGGRHSARESVEYSI